MKGGLVISLLVLCALSTPPQAVGLKEARLRRETEAEDLTEDTIDFAQYQDGGKCFQTPTTYYGYYRSYLDDPVLDDMCLIAKQLGPPVNGTVAFDAAYLRNGEVVRRPNILTPQCSTHGSNVSDCIRVPVHDSPGAEYVQYNFLYFKCGTCAVVWTPQLAEDACVLRVTDLNNIDESCTLAYDRFCGPHKYLIYDEDVCPEVYETLQ
ncbi:uncharacterized protein LOC135378390 [Ornithodoros turicata]|uniref:uncharacterized protein LOC135378390 n=1 Tax=Ornithodoros turicata TaxID=34597 RepID=UPI00313A22CC